MARSYKSSSGRITQRRSGGQFRATTLQDFGISQSELSDGNMICANCNYGEGVEKWRPVLKTGYCPKCHSQEKKSAQQSVQPTLLESEDIFDADGEVIGTRSVPIKSQSG